MPSLHELVVLAVDCQTTGGSPARARVIELAWGRARACDAPEAVASGIVSTLLALPPGERLPRRISALTGITAQQISSAPPPASAWRRLLGAARADGAGDATPVVAHYARFEGAFLEALHASHGPAGAFPLELICTHSIARRLLPDLPRASLRALSGYFGHVMEPSRRAAAHVAATVVVWRELVSRLRRDLGLTTLADLRDWLDASAPRRASGRSFAVDRRERLGLPRAPGVYRLLARGGAVLYVGKATSLQRRVNSYFQKRRHDDRERTLELLTQARRVEVTVTASPLEAALLEADEIKRLAPPYNKALRRGDEAAWYGSLDLGRLSRGARADCPLGPFPSPHAIGPLAELVRLLRAGPRAAGLDAVRRALGLPDSVRVEPADLAEGLSRFCLAHGVDGRPPLAELLRLGARLWRSAATDRSREREAIDVVDQGATRPRRALDAEGVSTALEGVVRSGARLVRRGHLLCQLCEASILYRPKGGAGAARRLLVVERSVVVRAEDTDGDVGLPVPRGHGRSRLARQEAIDGAAHDRLRVLVTELKRLTTDGSPVALRLGPRGVIGSEALRRRLCWV